MILWGLVKTFSQAFFLILSMSDSIVVVVVAQPHIYVLRSTVLQSYLNLISTAVGLAQSVECLTAERGFDSGVRTILRVLKSLLNEGNI